MHGHTFELSSGHTIEVRVKEYEGSIVTSQRLLREGKFLSKQCTVTCSSTGKSYSWTCSDNQDCIGDCSDPNNPRGRCI
jgi:hypothetical protein